MNDDGAPKGATETTAGKSDAIIRPGTDIAADLRRRRAASRRLPVLADGRRDTLDPLDKPRPTKVVQVRAVGSNTVQFIGSATAVYAACKKAGARFMPHPRRNEGLLVRDDFAEAVMADLERRGYRMDVTL